MFFTDVTPQTVGEGNDRARAYYANKYGNH